MKKVYALKNCSIEGSASGAAFPTIVLALDKMLACKGQSGNLIVYGAAFDEKFNVTHQRAESIYDCEKFKGSKYVQSNLGNSFSNVLDDLKRGKTVLFTGTPCQIFALKNYVMKANCSMENLYLADLICHGTPVPIFWKDYIAWLEKKLGSELEEFSFRYQKAKWKNYPAMAKMKNGKRYVNTYEVRLYTSLFFTHLTMRDGCYSCKFANLNRPSDITIGDFWGIKECIPDFPYQDSVSQILVNTEKGEQLLDLISHMGESVIVRECKTDDYLKYQHNLTRPTERPVMLDAFRKDYKENGFSYILTKYAGYGFKNKMKHNLKRLLIGIGIKRFQ